MLYISSWVFGLAGVVGSLACAQREFALWHQDFHIPLLRQPQLGIGVALQADVRVGGKGKHDHIIPLNRTEMASFLQPDRSAMARELNAMRDEGLIDFDGNTFTLKV